MNGRMYDPVIGRVLSPDNFVQDPTNTQSYNRYSYCLNNPLRYTDPSGWFAAAADQYWNMGKDITDFISFSGMRASSTNGTSGGGQGWGGVGGVVPIGIHWMPKSMPKGVTVDDLMGSARDATPSDGKLYTYTSYNGDWYNTSTSSFTYDNQGDVTSGGEAISAAGDDESMYTFSYRGYGMSYHTINLAPAPPAEIPKWGKMYIISNALSNANLVDGHAWLRFESRKGNVTTMSLWCSPFRASELFYNKESGMGYGVASKEYTINVAQYEQIIKYNSDPGVTMWSTSNTCAGYCVRLWNYITGDNLSANDILGYSTPRALTNSIYNDN